MDPRTTEHDADTGDQSRPERAVLRGILEAVGIACIVAAAFLASPVAGLLVLGLALIVVASVA